MQGRNKNIPMLPGATEAIRLIKQDLGSAGSRSLPYQFNKAFISSMEHSCERVCAITIEDPPRKYQNQIRTQLFLRW